MEKKLNILHLEDSKSDAELVNRILKKAEFNFEKLVVDTRAEFIHALEKFSPDIILSDHSLPSFNSHEALVIMQASGLKVPFILITANVSEEFAVDVIKKGADDYILKDRLERLPIAIINCLEKFNLATEKQQNLFQLIQNERHYRALVENGADVLLVLSEHGKPSYVSPSIKRVLGYTEKETLELNLYELLHPDDRAQVEGKMIECLEKPGIPLDGHIARVKNKNGEWIWLEATLTNMFLDPAINGIVNNFRDISRRIKAEELVKNSEEKYRSFYENSMDGILLTVTDGQILAANPTACKMFQMTEEEICEAGRFGLVDLEDPRIELAIEERKKNGRAKTEITCVRKDGSKFPVELTAAVFKDALGNDLTSMIVRDISESKAAEELILESERQYQNLIQDLPVAVYTTDAKGKILIHNKAAVELWGREPGKDDLFGGALKIYTTDGTLIPYNELPLVVALNEGRTVYGRELVIERPDGTKRNVNPFPTPKFDTNGQVIGGVNILIDITDRKINEQKVALASKELQQSERQYRQIVETAQEGIWLVDQDEKTIFVNDKLSQFLGYEKAEIIGRTPAFFMGNESRGKAPVFFETKENGVSVNSDVRYLSKSGKELWGNTSSNAFFDVDGNYSGSLSMISDITDKKALENLFDKATSLARIGSYEVDLLTNKVFWSPMTKEILEVDDDFIPDLEKGMNFYKPGLSRDTIVEAFNEAIEKNKPFDLELQLITAKGNERWVRAIGQGELRNGTCIRLYGSFQDIEKVRQTELNVLKVSEEKNVILESIDDAFFAIDREWVVTYWNKHAEKLLQTPKCKIVGKNLWSVFDKTQNASSFDNYSEALEKNSVQHFEAHYEQTEMWFDVTAYPSPNGLSVYFKNISERKISELKLLELNRELQKYTEELVISNTELEQFSYIISHNMRAPVANIMGLTEELKDESHSAETKQVLNTALSSCVKLLNEVIVDLNTILTVKKEISQKREAVNLSDLITDVQLSISYQIETENVEVTTNFHEIDKLITHKSYLFSIFSNLISNSIKYRQPDLQPCITIKAEIRGQRIVITYADNGLGIDLVRRKEQVFGLYKRFHQHIQGKGMGLFMVKTQVQTMGGTISIKSEVNKGTEFEISFPL